MQTSSLRVPGLEIMMILKYAYEFIQIFRYIIRFLFTVLNFNVNIITVQHIMIYF